jgi:site-specific recombinase XerD
VLVSYGAALRSSEVLALTVADVDLPNALITVRDSKFFKSRLVPVGQELVGH